MSDTCLSFKNIRQSYFSNNTKVEELFGRLIQKIENRRDDGVWITLVPKKHIMRRAKELDLLPVSKKKELPLFGLPFSVKDCIDVAGLPTTSACPKYKYSAHHTNLAVQRALDAGAILLGKTNMDQFATGVVGVRTPYGVARNPFNPEYIPGGSSSGSAVSVSAGLCAFAFGTDTGGSGRVPASYNNIVGLKPTLGLLSRVDMVNASMLFDTVSIYALTASDAKEILQICEAVDDRDAYGRKNPAKPTLGKPQNLRIAIPKTDDLEFFGNVNAEALYQTGIETLAALGHKIHEIEFDTFFETSKMMFEGPLLAERYAAVGKFVECFPDEIDPTVKSVINASKNFTAVDAFKAIYQLDRNIRYIQQVFNDDDIIAVPTVGTVYRIDEVSADPFYTNSTNGLYMNFVNMADLCAIAVPNGFLKNGLPMGITLIAPAFNDLILCDLATELHPLRVNTMGATQFRLKT